MRTTSAATGLAIAVMLGISMPGASATTQAGKGGLIDAQLAASVWKSKPRKGETTATMEREGGIDVYEIEFVKDGVKTSVEAAANGAILETERELKPAEAPAAVKEAIQKRFPNAEMKTVEEITPVIYEVKVLKDGKVKEVKLNGAGRPVGDDDDDDDDEEDED